MKRLFLMGVVLISFLVLLSLPVMAASVNLAQDANTEVDLAGYKIYLVNQADAKDFKLLKDVVAPNKTTTVTVDIVGAGVYVIVATAYDFAKNESAFSSPAVDANNVVGTFKDTTPPGAPKFLKFN